MSQDIRLISLETGGNQAYIFATNKLRNIVGASELLYRAGTGYVTRALDAIGANYWPKDKDIKAIEKNPDQDFEIIISTSGKAFLLARGEDRAKAFITAWSGIVASEAPGVDAVAVYSKTPVDLSLKLDGEEGKSPNSYMRVFRETEKQMSLLRMREGLPLTRFQRLPIVAECAYSGLPAVALDNDGRPVSASCRAQRDIYDDKDFRARMRKLFPDERSAERCLSGLNSLEKLDWLAVIHADGNGLGQLFINFADHVRALVGKEQADGRHYVNYYRRFSNALDEISAMAFKGTVEELWGYSRPDIVPIVVGGDDLTVVMDGYESIEFAERFMENFCSMTATHEDTKPILESANLPQLGMCAGISIAKPHFPFSQSYSMAEGLMKNAKQVKTQYGPDSIALDFHILYDSVSTSISDIRSRLNIRDRTLTEKPYVIHEGKAREGTKLSEEWAESHKFAKFALAAEAVKKLPSSQAHGVRDALFSEMRETQEAEWAFLLSSYPDFAKAWEKVQNDSGLYVAIDGKEGKPEYRTCYLDALEAMKFWQDREGGAKK